jgi:RNA polymerase sigma factor (sigma-70 family)
VFGPIRVMRKGWDVAAVEQVRQLRDPGGRARTHEELYEDHGPALRRRCLRLTRDPHAADDLVQEVFVRFMARFPEPPADMNVAGYLYATARNVLWKQLRDDHEVADPEIESSVGSDDDLEVDPERAALLVEQQGLVRRCSAVLTGRQRRALTLREVEGHSYAEIGSDLGIGPDAVAQVISRARARLRVAVRRAHVDLDQLTPECRAMLGPLSDYLDGHAAKGSREIEAHLAECEVCRRTLSAFKGAGSRLRGTLPVAPLAGVLARIGEAVRLGGGAPADAVRAGAVVVAAAALAIGGGSAVVVHEATGGSHRGLHVSAIADRGGARTGVAPSGLAPRVERAPSVVRGSRTRGSETPRRSGHPGTKTAGAAGTARRPGAAPGATPVAGATPGSAPGAAPSESPTTTTAAVDPGPTRPATTPRPPTDTVVPPVTPGGDLPRAVDPVTQGVGTKIVSPVVDKTVAPVVQKVVAPVVDKVVVPVVKQVVAPLTQPVTKAVASVTAPVEKALAPVTTPVEQAVAPVTDPVVKAVAPVTDPVAKVVNAALPPTAPAATTPAAADATPAVKLPPIQIGGIKIGG